MEATARLEDTGSKDAAGESYRFRYEGDGGDLFLVLLKNVLLTVVTFGIYAAWAKAARRRYIWSQVDFHGQRLAFTGTGKEMFIGYLKVAAAYFVLFGIPAIVGAVVGKGAQAVLQVGTFFLLMLLLPYAIYSSRAYILARTRWRGIKLGLVGSPWAYARTFIVGSLLTVLTLGIYSPWLSVKLRGMMTNNTRFGSAELSYDGNGRELFGIWWKGVLLTIVTFGIAWFWLQANMQRYHFAHTRLGNARFDFALTGGDLFKIALGHMFGTTFTLGVAFPWIATWSLRTVLGGISLQGHVSFDQIAQRTDAVSAASEGLADALGVDLGV